MATSEFFARRGTAIALSILVSPAVFGCSGTDRLKKQVSALESQLTAMRADQDHLEERLASLELATPVQSKKAAAPAAERVEHPRLKVIHLAPDDEASAAPEPEGGAAPSEAGDRGGKRPIIRGSGDRVIKVGDGDESAEGPRSEREQTRPVALARDTRGE